MKNKQKGKVCERREVDGFKNQCVLDSAREFHSRHEETGGVLPWHL